MKKDPTGNAVIHGCRCKKVRFLPDEDPADYERLRINWLCELEPKTPIEMELLDQILIANWQMLRSQRRYEDYQFKLAGIDADEWTPDQHRNVAVFHRYKTADHNTFQKSVRLFHDHRAVAYKTLRRVEALAEKVEKNAMLPPENQQIKQDVRIRALSPFPVPASREDGGCGCDYCLWCLAVDRIKDRVQEMRKNPEPAA